MNKKYNEYLREAERREEEEKERTAFLDMDFSKTQRTEGKSITTAIMRPTLPWARDVFWLLLGLFCLI